MFTCGTQTINDRPCRAHRGIRGFAAAIAKQRSTTDRNIDGHITESGTYVQLVHNPDSRFRALMAAQLNATSEETFKQTPEPERTKEQEQLP